MGVDLCCDSKLDSYKTSLNHRLPFNMEAIKKKMQAMKLEKDNAMDRSDACEQQAKDANVRAEKAEEEVRELQKKMQQLESDLDQTQEKLMTANQRLEEKEKALQNAEGEVNALNKRVSGLEEELEKTEEKLLAASQKLGLASTAGDDSQRMCKVLENKALSDEARMETLTNQLKDARNLAEEADKKYDEIAKKLQGVEADLERAEERADTGETKIIELE